MSAKTPETPTISHVGEDRLLVELLYDPATTTTALAVGWPDGRVSVEQAIDLPTGERLGAYGPRNNLIATGCVLLPSEVGVARPTSGLVSEIKAFLARYVVLSPLFADIAAHYVLLSWVYDAFGELPYLRFRGDYGTGKTRALLAVGSLCYKPFFASGASTVSPIFHVLDGFRGTLILDEADFRHSDATAELTKILNNGNADGLPVLRTMSNRHRELNPQAFRVYGPKLIAMRESFSDAALESRFLTEETTAHDLGLTIPIHLPRAFHHDARELRNRLLAWRFTHRWVVGVDPSRALIGVEPRLNQTALALLSLVEDEGLRKAIGDGLIVEHDRRAKARATGTEGRVVTAIIGAFSALETIAVTVSALTAAVNHAPGPNGPLTPKAMGGILRRLQILPARVRGSYVVRRSELPRAISLARRYGIDVEA